MARFTLRNNAQLDLLTQAELAHELDRATADFYQEAARGVSTARFDATGTVAAGAVTLPGNDGDRLGPQSGLCWAVQRITAHGLAASDTLDVWRNNTANPANYLGQVTATSALHVGSKGVILRGGETLHLTGASLTATGDITVNGEVIEVPELDIYKLL